MDLDKLCTYWISAPCFVLFLCPFALGVCFLIVLHFAFTVYLWSGGPTGRILFGIADVTKSWINQVDSQKVLLVQSPVLPIPPQLYSCSNTISAGVILFGDGAMWCPFCTLFGLDWFQIWCSIRWRSPCRTFPQSESIYRCPSTRNW